MTGLIILAVALCLDVLLGEAPNRFHPVAWLGKLISLLLKLKPASGRVRQTIYGIAIVAFSIAGIVAAVYFLTGYLQTLNAVAYVLVCSYLLKNTFSLRGLWKAVERVKTTLRYSDLSLARVEVRSLVERSPDSLGRDQLVSAAIESCAENLCDSFVAPLFYFALFGLPGAVAYRIANTFDAMIGYRGEWEYAGKFAARLDDVLNYIPARLSAMFIIAAAGVCRCNAASGWRTMLDQHGRTESPNAGWTMSAMAGALGVTLEKAGHYRLGAGGNQLSLTAVDRSQAILLVSASLWGIMLVAKEVIVGLAA